VGTGGGKDTGESLAIGDFGLRIADLFENAKNWKKFVFIYREWIHFKIFSDRINRMDRIFSRFINETVKIASA
jgi:hypothetical protein